ncbi:hypothetical protein CALCODRAFT_151144 [Calocera cornea HHB12733]|uniref:Uncharacterized protein n=1 Tax=Calocera cornea HHB12733 TaxID=1353952 RepID=A0A165I523_9BASI|nr:hypothetical protein CALCODRAFT_151144 [Calocera cornea HHB12733]
MHSCVRTMTSRPTEQIMNRNQSDDWRLPPIIAFLRRSLDRSEECYLTRLPVLVDEMVVSVGLNTGWERHVPVDLQQLAGSYDVLSDKSLADGRALLRRGVCKVWGRQTDINPHCSTGSPPMALFIRRPPSSPVPRLWRVGQRPVSLCHMTALATIRPERGWCSGSVFNRGSLGVRRMR